GHTPSLSNPVTTGNRTNIDSGFVFGGKLSCAVFDDEIAGGPIDMHEGTIGSPLQMLRQNPAVIGNFGFESAVADPHVSAVAVGIG
ncbi:hypothetical protein AB9E11_35735, partial [Rhizobium leguminosarum]